MARAEDADTLLLVIAEPDDPIVSRFAPFANEARVAIWRPRSLEVLGCAVDIDGRSRMLTLRDVCVWGTIDPARLAGIWYRGMPPITAGEVLSKRDLDYARAEFRSLIRMIWHVAACPAIGIAPDEDAARLTDSGLEARVLLRRVGLPAVPDIVGSRDVVDQMLARETGLGQARITHHDGLTTPWIRNATDIGGAEGESRLAGREPVAATLAGAGPLHVVIQVDSAVQVIEVGSSGSQAVVPPDSQSAELLGIVARVHKLIGARLLCSYLCLYGGDWRLVRISLQVPDWLVETTAPWLFPRLLAMFRRADPVSSAPVLQ